MRGRSFLHEEQSIRLCEHGNPSFPRTFTITEEISDKGASVICYEAFHQNGGRGILKEYYPRTDYGAIRREDGQLIHPEEFGDSRDAFLKGEKEYIQQYEKLLKIKQSGRNPVLSTFLPAFEIYHGCDEDGHCVGTTYVWTPEPKLETFDRICDEIHANPDKHPESHLVKVLLAIYELTKCVCELHKAEMLHRDIKPSNFGFIKRGNETRTQAISLFDVDSICSIYGESVNMGTDGYMEPEAKNVLMNNQSDIYSIGATLFTAIIITDETRKNGYIYEDKYFDSIRDMVNSSDLIRSSESNSHPRLRDLLTRILENCLCKRKYRYENCEELIRDLSAALYYALPPSIADKRHAGERWVLADVENALDKKRDKNSSLAIQYHLYDHPLYENCGHKETDLNILVIGLGNYGQKFLDACLQSGQIRGKNLHVTAVFDDRTDRDIYLSDRTDDRTDRDIYLSNRPELADFFNIDGARNGETDLYGNISFQEQKLDPKCPEAAAEMAAGIVNDCRKRGRLHYIFVALRDDTLNLAAADACRKAAGDCCTISYAREKEEESETESLCPVCMGRDITKHPLYSDIERMAFNTHLIWEKSLNIDYSKVRAEFKKKYNHDSSVSCVLSLKYKLYSTGIDLDTVSFEEAARRTSDILSEKKNSTLRNDLIWMEHRRWVTEKLCLGWRRLRNLDDCVGGMTYDARRRRHICIVKSRPDQKLAGWNKQMWDTASKSKLAQLDDLDRMSVDLHRMYTRKSETISGKTLLSGSSISSIRALSEGDRQMAVAFQEWFACLQDICDGETGKVPLYKGLRDELLAAAEALPKEQRMAAAEQIRAFESLFYPVLAKTEYIDYKQNDVALVDNIPFILTYSDKFCLTVPFAFGDSTQEFGNVAAATVINPSKICFLYLVESREDLDRLKAAIPYAAGYMRRKHFRSDAELVIFYTVDAVSLGDQVRKEKIRECSGGRFQLVRQAVYSPDELRDFLLEQQKKCGGRTKFFLERNETRLSCMMQKAGIYDDFSGYRFNSKSMEFRTASGSEALGYIRKKPYLTVADIAAFHLSSGESGRSSAFFADYEELWKKYSGDRDTWKLLCRILNHCRQEHDVLAAFAKKPETKKQKQVQTYVYILPSACLRSAEKIVGHLKKEHILEEKSSVSVYTTDSCKIVLEDRCGYRELYDRLFSDVYKLMLPDCISAHMASEKHAAVFRFDSLFVRNLNIAGGRQEQLWALMNFFQGKGYIINLTADPEGMVSFVYATRQVKQLLTEEGRILEIYTWYKAKEMGEFDDVAGGYAVKRQDSTGRIACVITKGFRSLFVECRAAPDVQPEVYSGLSDLAQTAGINATAVLITDRRENNFHSRNQGDVITIWQKNEIEHIGEILSQIMNGDYTTGE